PEPWRLSRRVPVFECSKTMGLVSKTVQLGQYLIRQTCVQCAGVQWPTGECAFQWLDNTEGDEVVGEVMVGAVVADEYMVGFRGVTDNVEVGGRPGKPAVSVVPDGDVEVSVVVGTDFDATERNGVSSGEGVAGEWDGECHGVSLCADVCVCGRNVLLVYQITSLIVHCLTGLPTCLWNENTPREHGVSLSS